MKIAVSNKSQARREFARNFRSYQEGKFGFQEWFEKHKALESRFGPEPWPGLEQYTSIS